jgi:hypothetical protein
MWRDPAHRVKSSLLTIMTYELPRERHECHPCLPIVVTAAVAIIPEPGPALMDTQCRLQMEKPVDPV